MRRELESVLAAAQILPVEELPRLVGALAEIQAVAMARLTAPAAQGSSAAEEAATLDMMQAADYVKMSPKWLYRNLSVVPHLRIGNGRKPRIRFRRRDLDAWLQEHSMKP